jgi:oxygen-independent coproporphyrinogen-3 oxidase
MHRSTAAHVAAHPETLSALARNVPRYTSYPTAPHFTAAVDGATYRTWLGTLPDNATLSLYLHVPFCAQLCHYCGCHTKVTQRREPIERYAGRLVDEIRLLGEVVGRRRVVHLHWGGGTPSILGNDGLARLHAALAEAFDLDDVREHAIELDPRHVEPSLARALAGIGVNRVSLGVQDLNAEIQKAIGRVQPFEIVSNAVDLLREAGIASINFDLMYGLPKQTVRDVTETAVRAHALSPSRLAVFGYAHVPWMKSHQRLIEGAALPGLAERHAQAQAAHATLIELGYQAIGLDHYAGPGDSLAVAARQRRLRRNFQGYTTDDADALIGIGASAIGRLPQGYAQNAPDLAGYARAIAGGRFAVTRGLALSNEDRLRGRIIERLMCDLEVDLREMVDPDKNSGRSQPFADELDRLAAFAADGLAVIEGATVTVTERGRPFVRMLAAVFDAYLPASAARHSMAV